MAPAPAEAKRRWTDLRARAISAGLLAPAVLGCLWVGGIAFQVLLLVTGVILALEWLAMCGHRLRDSAGALLVASVVVMAGAAAAGQGLAVVVVCVLATVAMVAMRRGAMATGVVYVGLGVAALIWLRDDPVAGRWNLLVLVLLVWASDIGAYMVGRIVGGPKLAPRISPGKTWSGAAGGLVVAVLIAGLVAWAVEPRAPDAWTVAVAVIMGVVAQAGDLFESLMKRRFGVKDSGHIIPGHGGVLDRLDALLAAAPVAVILALASGRGVIIWA